MRRVHSLGLPLFLAFALVGCDDGGSSGTDSGTPPRADAGGGPVDDAGTTPGVDAGTPQVDGGPAGTDAGTPSAAARVVVGHLGGSSFRIDQIDATSLAATAGSPHAALGAYNDVAVHPTRRLIALVYPSRGEVALLDGDRLTPVAGSPLAISTTPLTAAFDVANDRLVVYAADGPSERRLFVFELGDGAPTPRAGSPYDVDVVATKILFDASTDRMVGISSTTLWVGRLGVSGLELQLGSPRSARPMDAVLDEGRRRLYYTSSFPSQLTALDLDTLEPVSGSPVALPGDFPTSLAIDPDSGGLFVLDGSPLESGQPTTLHYVAPEPLAVQDTCGAAAGCTLDTAETGLALDPGSDRLFVAVVNGDADGELAVFDVSTPTMPMEIGASSRPTVGPVPAWVLSY